MISLFKTKQELDVIVNSNKDEKIIRIYFEKYKQYEEYKKLVNTLEELYSAEYPNSIKTLNADGSYNSENINYLEYYKIDKVETLEGTIETYIYKDEYYDIELDEFNNISSKTLKPEYQELLDKGQIRPTFELFKDLKVEEFIKDSLPTYDDIEVVNEYIEFIKPVLISKINEQYQTTMDKIKSGYPEAEQQTWYQQYQEALAYKADNTSSIPLISKIATSRGVDINILVDKIIAKYESYSELIGETTGLRQQAEDYINTIVALNDVDEFNNRFKEYVEIFNAKLQEVTEQS